MSKEVAIEMAQGALNKSQAQVSISITGIGGEDMKKGTTNNSGIAWICCLDIYVTQIIKCKKNKR